MATATKCRRRLPPWPTVFFSQLTQSSHPKMHECIHVYLRNLLIITVIPIVIVIVQTRFLKLRLLARRNRARELVINWSQIAKGLPLATCPNLDRSIFSPNQSQQIHISHPEYSKTKRPLVPTLTQKNQHKIILNKSFTFTPSNLAHLLKLALHNNNNDNDNGPVSRVGRAPTNFELISALVWICWTRATQVGPDKTTQILTAVDGRPKLGRPLAPGYFGNGIVWSCARSKAQMLTSQPFSYAVGIARDAIKTVNEVYIRSAIDFHEVTRKPLEQENTLWITKWSRLPFYEADFGWGGAEQVAPALLVDNLVVYLSQGRESGNLVISVRLPAEAMEVFEELIES